MGIAEEQVDFDKEGTDDGTPDGETDGRTEGLVMGVTEERIRCD